MNQMAVKFSESFTQFDGTGDFSAWVERFEVVSRLQKVTDLANLLPLFLTGGAFAVYQGLSDAAKADYSEVKRALTAAFSPDCFKAYAELSSRQLRANESIDVYASELTRLLSLVVPVNAASAATTSVWLKCAFVEGLPDAIRRQLKAACSLPTMSLTEVVERARQIVAFSDVCLVSADRTADRAAEDPRVSSKRMVCFLCKETGHYARNCTQ